ncbi:hypothetical protein AB0J37_18840 [Microbispora rosea]|uniref:hypothetical protein n=1 Tax=Microbispora rosea TaxID=58117 RepID=UPI003423D08C
MIDISQPLTLAHRSQSWTIAAAVEAAATVASHVRGEVDWDEGAGEEWARVILEGESIFMISMAMPFAIASLSVPEDAIQNDLIQVVWVPSLGSPVLTCDPEALEAGFGDLKSRSSVSLAIGGFSAKDLWYITV